VILIEIWNLNDLIMRIFYTYKSTKLMVNGQWLMING